RLILLYIFCIEKILFSDRVKRSRLWIERVEGDPDKAFGRRCSAICWRPLWLRHDNCRRRRRTLDQRTTTWRPVRPRH
ncbi:MAG TPA: hypothetical protein PLD10_15765, partial [Rhodopila sp.]|nr:hypothetical protein [Rhodopila sp.]